MGVNIPPTGLKEKTKHTVVIEVTGPLSEKDAQELKRELDYVLDKYRDKCGGLTPPQAKR